MPVFFMPCAFQIKSHLLTFAFSLILLCLHYLNQKKNFI